MAGFCRSIALLTMAYTSDAYNCPSGSTELDGGKCGGGTTSTCSVSTCCDHEPCSTHSVTWKAAQILGTGGCWTDGAKAFFDAKKSQNAVATPREAPQIIAACCTPLSESKCSDWPIACPNGKVKVGTNKAGTDSADGKSLSAQGHQTRCCEDKPKTCSDYSVAWIAAAVFNQGCRKDGAKQFFDLKKSGNKVKAAATAATDSEIASVCCSPVEKATCSDYTLGYGCASGLVKNDPLKVVGVNDATGYVLKKDTFKAQCCGKKQHTCDDFKGTWVAATLAGNGCRANDAKSFFDLKKLSNPVSGDEPAAVIQSCCTGTEHATCGDWVLNSCNSNTYKKDNNIKAPANTDNKLGITASTFKDTCCGPQLSCAEVANGAVSQAAVSLMGWATVISGLLVQPLM